MHYWCQRGGKLLSTTALVECWIDATRALGVDHCLAVGLLAIAAATLTPLPLNEYRAAETPFWCLVCGSLGLIDVILNVALFLPLGVGLQRLGWPLARLALACFLLSLAVESLQIITIAGRDASVSDLITNTSGGILGGFIAHHWRAAGVPFPSACRPALLGRDGGGALGVPDHGNPAAARSAGRAMVRDRHACLARS